MNRIRFQGKCKFLHRKFREDLRKVLDCIANEHRKKIESLVYVVCTDKELLEINRLHLNHNTYTDIITFDLSDQNLDTNIDGEIYISKDRVLENALTHNVSFTDEMVRVSCHGILHLLGFKDKTPKEAEQMQQMEESSLSLWCKITDVSRETATIKP